MKRILSNHPIKRAAAAGPRRTQPRSGDVSRRGREFLSAEHERTERFSHRLRDDTDFLQQGREENEEIQTGFTRLTGLNQEIGNADTLTE